ncbi:HAD family hydrolase [Promicromonospora thailandica]|uniref:Phosphoglycolate phosphatase, HAD superfamily n=1 Tax=Promicromonospora thailandica TaxID=765201 RepID=A0A9X2JUJ3_9MICO|nr:haloacid dehalogenase-like hydrolase [Promicromonospora thailandica]MCP2263522.1 Phosphoglycolate phosphatase, HAD superfamily [Promicromonospora thailandica]BFF19298.1 haloacid dehalogenase-like hydrolase [Promicromonospora thailandica]
MTAAATSRGARALVLWDIDRTLVYVGEVDRTAYREAFAEVVGRPAERLPARGTGMTMPLAIRGLLEDNGVGGPAADELVPRMLEAVPRRFAAHTEDVRRLGTVLPGAMQALKAVAAEPDLVATVVTGNLEANARIKLNVFGMDRYLDPAVGGYSSDDAHRPALVAIAQYRAGERYGAEFGPASTVVVGDSLEDVRTGVEGGASVIAVASGTTTADRLAGAGADVVLPDLTDAPRLIQEIKGLTGLAGPA